jgi:hypothetical protein
MANFMNEIYTLYTIWCQVIFLHGLNIVYTPYNEIYSFIKLAIGVGIFIYIYIYIFVWCNTEFMVSKDFTILYIPICVSFQFIITDMTIVIFLMFVRSLTWRWHIRSKHVI